VNNVKQKEDGTNNIIQTSLIFEGCHYNILVLLVILSLSKIGHSDISVFYNILKLLDLNFLHFSRIIISVCYESENVQKS
jgi:hypothetical protein